MKCKQEERKAKMKTFSLLIETQNRMEWNGMEWTERTKRKGLEGNFFRQTMRKR